MIFAMSHVRLLMTFIMESEIRDYRLERWLAAILALLFLLPFVVQAQAAEAPVVVSSSRGATPVVFSAGGTNATLAWRCKDTGIDDFEQCALVLDGKVLTWRMAPRGEELTARVRLAGDLDGDEQLDLMVEISRNGREWQSSVYQRVLSHSSRRMP
jgi:hypothetical protein